jgi:membrane-bound lytic murein transglycosylase B
LLTNAAARREQIDNLGAVAGWLGQGQFVPSERAASIVLDLINWKKP